MKLATWLSARPQWMRRFLAIGLLPLGLLLILAAGICPVVALVEGHRAWLQEAAQSIAKNRGLHAAEKHLKEQLHVIDSAAIWSMLYDSEAPSSPTNALQADVGGLLSAAGVAPQSIAPLSTELRPPFQRSGVRLTASMSTEQLRKILAAARAQHKLVRVEAMVISAPQMQIRDQNPTLAVSMDLYGYHLPRTRDSAETRKIESVAQGV